MAIKIGSTTVINNSKNLVGLGTGSGALSLSGSSLVLTIGGAQQDTQELDDTHTHDARYYTETEVTAKLQTKQNTLASNQKMDIAVGRADIKHDGTVSSTSGHGIVWSDGTNIGPDVGTANVSFNVGTLHSITASICSDSPIHAYNWYASVQRLNNNSATVYATHWAAGSWGSGEVYVCVTAIGLD